jgi:3,4-dihydroxy 2-butanone 4-phosphate synthase/GTP cyclohydrolase II
VICEIMNEDGTMARMPDLVPFAQRHGLKIGTIEDLIAYRLNHDRLVTRVAETKVDSVFGGQFSLNVYATATASPVEHLALVKGDLSAPGPVLVRVHAVNVLSDLVGVGTDACTGTVVSRSLKAIEREGRGVVVLIRDLGPKSVSDWVGRQAKTAAAASGEKAARGRRQVEIGVGSQILRDLGVHDMILLTNTPGDVYVGLDAYGLRIVGTRAIE